MSRACCLHSEKMHEPSTRPPLDGPPTTTLLPCLILHGITHMVPDISKHYEYGCCKNMFVSHLEAMLVVVAKGVRNLWCLPTQYFQHDLRWRDTLAFIRSPLTTSTNTEISYAFSTCCNFTVSGLKANPMSPRPFGGATVSQTAYYFCSGCC